MKAINKAIDKTITYLGNSNDSEIVTALLAACKFILVPFATMSDKKSTKEQKEYAVKRDFLTEGIALTGYLGITKAVKNTLTAPICKKYYKNKAKTVSGLSPDEIEVLESVDKKAIKNYAMKELSQKAQDSFTNSSTQKENIEKLEGVVKNFSQNIQNPKDLYLNTKKTLSHVCVCLLALTLIPFTTNKIMSIIANKKANKPQNIEPNINKPTTTNIKPLTFNQYKDYVRLGGTNVLRY